MISKRLLDALNDQFNYELESANIYLAMAGYTADLGLGGFTNWFMANTKKNFFMRKR
ncbi:putative ferritin [Francisella tularensis]|nr:putative ferritin [Francisella tularensis]